MTFGESIKTCFRKYAVFKGRACRSEYWWFVLFMVLIEIGIYFIAGLLMIPLLIKGQFNAASINSVQLPLAIVTLVVELALFLPSLSVQVRRFHDVNRTGWWILILFVMELIVVVPSCFLLFTMADHSPEFNDKISFVLAFVLCVFAVLITALAIVFLVWCCKRGTIGPNKYGPDPLEEAYVDVTPQAEV